MNPSRSLSGTFPTDPNVAAAIPDTKNDATTDLSTLGLKLGAWRRLAGTARSSGVVIKDVDGDSDAALKGLKQRDVILEVQGVTVKSPEDVTAGVKKARDAGRTAVLLRSNKATALVSSPCS
ncbi:MAG: PDZ domain-containing protein [Hyphomicrobiaceae bacterium]